MKAERFMQAIGEVEAGYICEAESYVPMRRFRYRAAAAALAACFLAAVCVAGSARGFFRDVANRFGAVTGSEYLQATEEIRLVPLAAAKEGEDWLLPLEIEFLHAEEAPFAYIEGVRVVQFSWQGVEYGADAYGAIEDGKVQITLRISGKQLDGAEKCALQIDTLWGESKADAPLPIHGEWTVEFVLS